MREQTTGRAPAATSDRVRDAQIAFPALAVLVRPAAVYPALAVGSADGMDPPWHRRSRRGVARGDAAIVAALDTGAIPARPVRRPAAAAR